MKIKVKERYNRSIITKYDIEINNRTFQKVNALYPQICEECHYSKNCPFYFSEKRTLTLTPNCKGSLVQSLPNILSIVIEAIILLIYLVLEESLFLAIIIAVIFHVIRSVIMKAILFFEYRILIKSLYKQNKKEDSLTDSNESKKEEKKQESLNIFKEKISQIQDIQKEFDFKSCNGLIKKIIKSLKEIVEILEKNNTSSKVYYLFEIELPEITNMLSEYAKLIKANCVDSEVEEILTETLKNFKHHVKKIKKETILNSNEDIIKMKFKASASFINNINDTNNFI